jgi:hypothetical protein
LGGWGWGALAGAGDRLLGRAGGVEGARGAVVAPSTLRQI